MINGLGVLGWGVGGIEAEAAMLGQPVSMLIPEVVGFKLHGKLPPGATATDLVLTVTEMLRKKKVVGKFVEFYGAGLSSLSLADRATIAQHGAGVRRDDGLLPGRRARRSSICASPDAAKRTCSSSRRTARSRGSSAPTTTPDPVFTDTIELDLGTRRAEPRRAEASAGPRAAQVRRSRCSATR